MITAADLARALNARKNGRGWRARCPAHSDAHPSLDIDAGEDGQALIICRAGCTQEAVLDALRRRGLWSRNGDDGDRLRHPDLGEPERRFDYFDASGRLLGAICRWDRPGGKEIRPAIWDGDHWRWKAFPPPRPLYCLPDIVARPDKPVLIVEGEKAADAAREIVNNAVVTTWPGGTGAVQHVDISPLAGRDIVLWPDNDDAGRKAMRALADRLTEARSLKGVRLPDGLLEGWDLGDAIPADLDLVAVIGGAKNLKLDPLRGLGLISAADLVAMDFRPPVFAVPDVIPEGLTIFAGRPKSGKSWAALDFCAAVASGGPALGNIDCDAGDVLYIALEDTERRLHGRLKAVLQGAPAPPRLSIATQWRLADEGGLDDLRAWMTAHPEARLVIIDTLAKIRGRPDRDKGVYDNDYATISAFKKLADDTGVPIVLVHHVRKETASDPLDSVSGTAGLTGSADTVLVLKREPNDPFGMLYVRGRDVHEAEFALQFSKDTGKWTRLGAADDWRKSQQRRAVIRALIEAGPMRPKQIAEAIGAKDGAVRRLLAKMRQDGEIHQSRNGEYRHVAG